MFRVLISYLYTIVAVIAALITIILFVHNVFGAVSEQGKLGIYFIGFFAIVFFIQSLWQKLRYSKAAQYGKILSQLNNGFAQIHRLIRKQDLTINEAILIVRNLLTEVADAFTRITGTKCCTSIKILAGVEEGNEQRLQIINLARDLDSENSRKYPKEGDAPHFVDENTDFLSILKNIDKANGDYYISNQLPLLYGYKNSSFRYYKDLPEDYGFFPFRALLRWYRWPLPYKSTIVVPIWPGTAKEISQETLVGFLCVDSPNMFAFNRDRDLDIMHGVAEGLYNAILKIKELV